VAVNKYSMVQSDDCIPAEIVLANHVLQSCLFRYKTRMVLATIMPTRRAWPSHYQMNQGALFLWVCT